MKERLQKALEAIQENDSATGTMMTETVLQIAEAFAVYGTPDQDGGPEAIRRAESLAELCELAAACESPEILDKAYNYLVREKSKELKLKAAKEAEACLMNAYIHQRALDLESSGRAKSKPEAITLACAEYNQLRQTLTN